MLCPLSIALAGDVVQPVDRSVQRLAQGAVVELEVYEAIDQLSLAERQRLDHKIAMIATAVDRFVLGEYVGGVHVISVLALTPA